MNKSSRMLHVTVAMVIRALFLALGEKGIEHVDPGAKNGNGCRYLDSIDPFDFVPSCIVGNVFHRFGMAALLMQYNCSVPAHSLIAHAVDANLMTIDAEAVRILRLAQDAQDMGKTWGEAVQKALTAHAEEQAEKFENLRVAAAFADHRDSDEPPF